MALRTAGSSLSSNAWRPSRATADSVSQTPGTIHIHRHPMVHRRCGVDDRGSTNGLATETTDEFFSLPRVHCGCCIHRLGWCATWQRHGDLSLVRIVQRTRRWRRKLRVRQLQPMSGDGAGRWRLLQAEPVVLSLPPVTRWRAAAVAMNGIYLIGSLLR